MIALGDGDAVIELTDVRVVQRLPNVDFCPQLCLRPLADALRRDDLRSNALMRQLTARALMHDGKLWAGQGGLMDSSDLVSSGTSVGARA